MRIAFISYEFPPDIAQGGIATYIMHASNLLLDRGHEIEIFCGSHTRNLSENIQGILIHRILTIDPITFQDDCLMIFMERHKIMSFDIFESPEIHGNGLKIKEMLPYLPLVVRLHMPLFIQMKLLNYYTSNFTKFRFFLGSLRRGKFCMFGHYNYKNDIDFKITALANGIVSPSNALKNFIQNEWILNKVNIKVIPNPFLGSQKLLLLPVDNKVQKVVTFIGKLNVHKGLFNLIKIIPLVVKNHPDVVFKLIGNDSYFFVKKMTMTEYIIKQLKGYENNYELLGGIDNKKVLKTLEETAVCIFPSIWENFGLVVLEAMSAARVVIGSKEGGMSEILSDGAGILIDPHNVKKMANEVINLLGNEKLRHQYGLAGRKKLLEKYNSKLIGEQMERHYLEVINE